MGRKFGRTKILERQAEAARTGSHYGAAVRPIVPDFKVGQEVMIKKTGTVHPVISIASWGDCELGGYKGKFFSRRLLEPVSTGEKETLIEEAK